MDNLALKKKPIEGIYQHNYPDGRTSWRIKYDAGTDILSGKRIQRGEIFHGTLSAAKKRRAELITKSKNTTLTRNNIRVSDWCEKWLKLKKVHVRTKTFQRYHELAYLHIIPHIGERKLNDLKPQDINNLYEKLRSENYRKTNNTTGTNRPLSEHTIKHVHALLRQIMQSALLHEEVARNICDSVDSPKIRHNASQSQHDAINALDKSELVSLLSKLKEHPTWGGVVFPISTFAAGTGMRRGEILALRWIDVQLDRNRLTCERSVEEVGRLTTFKNTKNKMSRRTIGIDHGLTAMLKDHRDELSRTCMSWTNEELPQTALIFPQALISNPNLLENYSKPLRPHYVSRIFRKAVNACGFSGFRFHDLRHTHATLLLTDGVPVNAVSSRLGHATPTMTLNVYGHVLIRAEEKSVEVAGKLLEGVFAQTNVEAVGHKQ